MSPEFTQKNSSLGAVFFNSLSREKSTQDEKVHFIKGNGWLVVGIKADCLTRDLGL